MPLKYQLGRSYRGLFEGTILDPFVLVEGRRGTAKTASILKLLTMRAFKFPGSRYLIARSTRVRLSESVIATFDNHVLPSFGLPTPTAAASHRTHYDFPTIMGKKSRFIFMALDDPGRAQSVEADGAYISEAVELNTIDQATALTGSIRQRLDARRQGDVAQADPFPGLVRQVILDANPGPPGHWLNKVAEPASDDLRRIYTKADYERTLAFNLAPSQGGWKRIITSLPDNPGYWDKATWSRTESCQRYIDGLGFMSPYMQARWVEGLWRAAEGVVFPEFDEALHVVDDFEPPGWPWHVGWDPGFAHPTGMPWCVVTPLGDVVVGDEIYEGGKSIAQHAEKVLRMASGRTIKRFWGDPHEFFSTRAQNSDSCAVQAQKAGLPPFAPWANQNKQAMVNGLRTLLQNTVTLKQTGKRVGPCLYVMRRCVNTIMEFQTWAFKRTASGELPPGDDAYVDADNHILDCLEGMVATGSLVWRSGSGGAVTVVENS